MKKAVCVEIVDKRDVYLLEALKDEGYPYFKIGEEEYYKDYLKVYVFSVLSEIKKERAMTLSCGSVMFSRAISSDVKKIIEEKNITHFNVLEDETFIVKNAYITAEGALSYILQNTDISINKMKVLVLGYGRVGKSVTKILRDNYAEISVATNDEKEYALASIYAERVYNLSDFKCDLNSFSAIVNTVPVLVLKGEELRLIDKDCFILDLASKPGGVDFLEAERLNLKFLHALGVPGKTAPKTAGLYIKDIIASKLSMF